MATSKVSYQKYLFKFSKKKSCSYYCYTNIYLEDIETCQEKKPQLSELRVNSSFDLFSKKNRMTYCRVYVLAHDSARARRTNDVSGAVR